MVPTADLKVIRGITVEEKATGEVMAGAGVGTDGTSFTVCYKREQLAWKRS